MYHSIFYAFRVISNKAFFKHKDNSPYGTAVNLSFKTGVTVCDDVGFIFQDEIHNM